MIFFVLAAASPVANSQQRAPDKRAAASSLLQEGSIALEKNDLQHAKVLFTRLLVLDPQAADAHTYLGVIADREGDLQTAERHFRAAVAHQGNSPQARNNYGAVLLRLGRKQDAALQFERSLQSDPDQPAALLNLADIRFVSGKRDDLNSARELLQHAEELTPDIETERALIMVDCRLNDAQRARVGYLKYKQTAEAKGFREEAVKRRDLGAALLNVGLYSEAVAELQEVNLSDPKDPAAVILLAKAQRALNHLPDAGKTLEAAVASGVQSGEIYSELAKVYEATGRPENAIPAMRLAIDREPANEDYRFRYGMLLTNTKAPQGAVLRLKEALEKFPKSAKLWFALGFAQLEDHKNADAQSSFLRSESLDQHYAPAAVFLGVTDLLLGNYKEAETHYQRGIVLSPHTAVLHEMMAEAMARQYPPNVTAAERELKRCIEMDPGFAPAHLELGKLYALKHEYQAAATELAQAVKLDPALTEAHYHLGRMYNRLKRREEAEQELQRFKALNEQDKDQEKLERQQLVQRLAKTLF